MDVHTPVFQLYIGSVLLLGLNLLWLAVGTAASRATRDEAVNPEDVRLNSKAKVVFLAGNDVTQRYRRAHFNALENNLLFLITAFLLTLTPVGTTTAAVLFGVFVGFRWLHSIAYVRSIQPLRTASFGIAYVTQVGVLGVLGYGVFA
jgi:prostaglandin-E synthase 1